MTALKNSNVAFQKITLGPSGLQLAKFLQPFIQKFAMPLYHLLHYISLKLDLFTWICNWCFFELEIKAKWWMLMQVSWVYNFHQSPTLPNPIWQPWFSKFCDCDLFNFFFVSQTIESIWLVKANVISTPCRLLHPGTHKDFDFDDFLHKNTQFLG